MHRTNLTIYDLRPEVDTTTYVAPNASVIGDAFIGAQVNILSNSVLRADLNSVTVSDNCVVGENTVITSVSALPTGLPSDTFISPGVVVGRNCTLVSCEIGQESLIGDRTVILEGARIGEASVIGPNSVVPPGRVIGDHQLWAGNPVRFIRDLKKSEMYAVRMIVRQENAKNVEYRTTSLSNAIAYLFEENSFDDLNIATEDISTIGNKYSDQE